MINSDISIHFEICNLITSGLHIFLDNTLRPLCKWVAPFLWFRLNSKKSVLNWNSLYKNFIYLKQFLLLFKKYKYIFWILETRLEFAYYINWFITKFFLVQKVIIMKDYVPGIISGNYEKLKNTSHLPLNPEYSQLPQIIFVFDIIVHKIFLMEAMKKKIIICGISNPSYKNSSNLDFPLFGERFSNFSILFILLFLKNIFINSKINSLSLTKDRVTLNQYIYWRTSKIFGQETIIEEKRTGFFEPKLKVSKKKNRKLPPKLFRIYVNKFWNTTKNKWNRKKKIKLSSFSYKRYVKHLVNKNKQKKKIYKKNISSNFFNKYYRKRKIVKKNIFFNFWKNYNEMFKKQKLTFHEQFFFYLYLRKKFKHIKINLFKFSIQRLQHFYKLFNIVYLTNFSTFRRYLKLFFFQNISKRRIFLDNNLEKLKTIIFKSSFAYKFKKKDRPYFYTHKIIHNLSAETKLKIKNSKILYLHFNEPTKFIELKLIKNFTGNKKNYILTLKKNIKSKKRIKYNNKGKKIRFFKKPKKIGITSDKKREIKKKVRSFKKLRKPFILKRYLITRNIQKIVLNFYKSPIKQTNKPLIDHWKNKKKKK